MFFFIFFLKYKYIYSVRCICRPPACTKPWLTYCDGSVWIQMLHVYCKLHIALCNCDFFFFWWQSLKLYHYALSTSWLLLCSFLQLRFPDRLLLLTLDFFFPSHRIVLHLSIHCNPLCVGSIGYLFNYSRGGGAVEVPTFSLSLNLTTTCSWWGSGLKCCLFFSFTVRDWSGKVDLIDTLGALWSLRETVALLTYCKW